MAGKNINMNAYKRNRNRSRSAMATAVIIVLAVLVYIFQSVYFFLSKPKIATELVNMGTVDLPHTIRGIIIRDEIVYTAEREGQLVFTVGDYERVKAGTAICSIQNTAMVEDINESMEDIESQIMALQSMRQDISNVDPAVQRINSQMKNMIDSRLYHFTVNNLEEIYALRDSVTQSLNARNTMILDDNRFVREDLGIQQQQLQTRLNEHTSSVSSLQAGLVSPIVDGMEAELNMENMKDLSREQTHFNVDYNKIIPKKEVAAGEPIFKIVASNDWFIGAYIPNGLIEGYEIGDKRTLYLENSGGKYQEAILTVEYISQNYNESYVLFRNNKNVIDFINMRNINLQTSDSVRTGFKISNTAITSRSFYTVPPGYVLETENGRGNYILAQTSEGAVQVSVINADEDSEFIYIPVDKTVGIAPGTQITAPDRPAYVIPEPAEVLGVYKVNNGYAEFERIFLYDDSPAPETVAEAGGYTVLDPLLNPGLKTYDYIVTRAEDASEGQIIKIIN